MLTDQLSSLIRAEGSNQAVYSEGTAAVSAPFLSLCLCLAAETMMVCGGVPHEHHDCVAAISERAETVSDV